ncbi:hypothetical protein FNU76_01720 [Chitinimonas arctica]|uniref:Uncharacterized protein n=1 Tax=Chitinimonas arctica TaxID=2594795 RepID=A0A516SAK3_9NEIS|nr:hypothetical protein [Chitinimonas arctica]QDQ25177.1 hypothetical protein FNU76_01720 [Chitinimonas arctica]
MKLTHLPLFAFVLIGITASGQAKKEPDVWLQALRSINYAATVKAGFVPGCKGGSALSLSKYYRLVCPKLYSIPNEIIESAALPYLKRHVSKDIALQAIAAWTSREGILLSQKMVLVIESGQKDLLTFDDLRMLDDRNRSEHGRAFGAFADDKEGSAAVVTAMSLYVPKHSR